jgi:hypothetical protein
MSTKHPTIESRLLAGHIGEDPDGRRRRLGRVYRLILNYDPEARAAARTEANLATSQAGEAQPAAG